VSVCLSCRRTGRCTVCCLPKFAQSNRSCRTAVTQHHCDSQQVGKVVYRSLSQLVCGLCAAGMTGDTCISPDAVDGQLAAHIPAVVLTANIRTNPALQSSVMLLPYAVSTPACFCHAGLALGCMPIGLLCSLLDL